MANISEDIKLEIKYRNDIESVISQYVNLKRRGKNLVGLCPFHNEKTPSFTVYPENGSYYCFGCGQGGDVITFVSQIEKLDYVEAVKLLADRSGITIPESGYDNSMQELKTRILDINRETARFYYSYLMSPGGKWALDYLHGRGLTDATIKRFGLGAAPDNWDMLIKHLKSKGFSIPDMLQANVISQSSRGSYFDRFRNRVMFPIFNLRGNVIAFSGRARPDDPKATGKYVNTQDTPVYKKSQHLFALNFAKNDCADRIILVEGNMDVISLHQAGFPNTVAALGTAFGAEQVKLLSRYTKEVVITMDADEAGQKAVLRTINELKDSGMSIRVLVIPDGKDPDEYIRKNGAAKFKMLLDKTVSDIEYKLLVSSKNIDVSSDNGRLQYLKKAAENLATVRDRLTVDLYAGRLAEKYGVSKTALLAQIEDLKKKNVRVEQKKEFDRIVTPRYESTDINPDRRRFPKAAKAEESLIAILLSHPDLYASVKERIKAEDMLTALNKRVYAAICSILDSGHPVVDITLLGEDFSPAEFGYIVSLQNGVLAEKNAKTVLNDCVKVILEENMAANTANDKDLSLDDWAAKMQQIAKTKKGE
ncbi:MAG: DNA primase [Ruminococcaceae bacterium]|nr:DNA primase [Oscillospiraceae bacterium]